MSSLPNLLVRSSWAHRQRTSSSSVRVQLRRPPPAPRRRRRRQRRPTHRSTRPAASPTRRTHTDAGPSLPENGVESATVSATIDYRGAFPDGFDGEAMDVCVNHPVDRCGWHRRRSHERRISHTWIHDHLPAPPGADGGKCVIPSSQPCRHADLPARQRNACRCRDVVAAGDRISVISPHGRQPRHLSRASIKFHADNASVDAQ